jgi:hypothetical protein
MAVESELDSLTKLSQYWPILPVSHTHELLEHTPALEQRTPLSSTHPYTVLTATPLQVKRLSWSRNCLSMIAAVARMKPCLAAICLATVLVCDQ